MAIWCEELTHLKRPWCWQRLKAGGEGDNRGWNGWIASPTQWTRVWINSRSWCWSGRPCMLQSMGSQRVEHKWVTKLNWMVNHVVHFFSYSCLLFVYFIWKNVYLSLLPNFVSDSLKFCYWAIGVLYIFWRLPPSLDTWFINIFFQLMGWLFTLFIVFFDTQKFFIL